MLELALADVGQAAALGPACGRGIEIHRQLQLLAEDLRELRELDVHLEDVLAGADVRLDDGTLDAIDEIVPPGTNFSWADAGWSPPGIADPDARRRGSAPGPVTSPW